MTEKYNGMEPLQGFPDRNAELEQQFPGLSEIFDSFYVLLRAPGDIRRSIEYDRDDFPIEAAIALPDSDGRLQVISRARNSTKSKHGSLGHAEMLAISSALNGDKHLPKGAVLLSTVEPCSMCAGGLNHSGGSQIIFSASQEDVRGRYTWVEGKGKPFRAEPEGYSARKHLLLRDPAAIVIGGYRRQEALDLL